MCSFIISFYKNTNLSDVDIMKGVNSLAGLFDILGNCIGQKFADDTFKVALGNIAADDFHHLLANVAYLKMKTNE